MDADNNTPSEYCCPITSDLMKDPVLAKDGNTYERQAITLWVEEHGTSPISRQPLSISDLVPNRALKNLIEEYCQREGIEYSPTTSSNEANGTESSTSFNDAIDSEEFEIEVSSQLEESNSKQLDAKISITPPNGTSRVPIDLCCVIDISGSMATEASIKTADGSQESGGLSMLDIVKHAVKTIVNCLGPNDRVALVSYSTHARLEVPITAMTGTGRKSIETKLDSLEPEYSTNIWAGLQLGLDTIRELDTSNRNAALMLLTDGLPNQEPPRGHIPTLNKYISKHGLPCTIETFGFGYQLDSKLLRDLAHCGKGSYSFIPDSGMVGTVFVHSLSNLLVTCARDVVVRLKPTHPAITVNTKNIVGGLKIDTSNNDKDVQEIRISSLQYGQTRDVVVPLQVSEDYDGSCPLQVSAEFEHVGTSSVINIEADCTAYQQNDDKVALHKARLSAVDAIYKAMDTFARSGQGSAREIIQDCIEKLTSDSRLSSNQGQDLIADLQGQVTEAISREDWYNRWGKHYLPSLAEAHSLQYCNNFKDPGVQHYGGEIFEQCRDKADDVFCALPAPQPSRRRHTSSSSNYSPSISMSLFHSAGNPCFSGDSKVHMADGTFKHVSQIKKGDLVMVNDQEITATVRCVVITPSNTGKNELVTLGSGLKITPYHPVLHEGVWKFPHELGKINVEDCEFVYSFVLDQGHCMMINDVIACTLGHGFTGNDVIEHPFYATQSVIKCLSKMKGFTCGRILLNFAPAIRDTNTDLVCDLIEAPDSMYRIFITSGQVSRGLEDETSQGQSKRILLVTA